MIRRSDLAARPRATAEIVRRVHAGESVRIAGLGTIGTAAMGAREATTHILTLTAKVAAAETGQPWSIVLAGEVHHLARALCAPVEVWSPARNGNAVSYGPALITTVQP